MNLFLPKDIKIGFQERSDTYNGKLAYVIYVDEKGVTRKEKSWNSWRDDKIVPLDEKNEPTSGFVLNKKVGGYSNGWDHRQTYTRVYDPRGWEFEITVDNLLYILDNCSSIKGKGLEGEFVYGWSGSDLVLVPVDAPDYAKFQAYSDQIFDFKSNKVKSKELVLGGTYKNKANENLIYLGRYTEYGWRGNGKLKYFFIDEKSIDYKDYTYYTTFASPSSLIGTVDTTPHVEFPRLVDDLEHNSIAFKVSPEFTKYHKIDEENYPQYFTNQESKVYFEYDGAPHMGTLRKAIQVDYSKGYNYTEIKNTDGEQMYFLMDVYEMDATTLLHKIVKAQHSWGGGFYDSYVTNQKFRTGSNHLHAAPMFKADEEGVGTIHELIERYNLTHKQEFLTNGNRKKR